MRPSANALARLGVFSIFICLLAAAVNFGSAAKSPTVKRAVLAEAASINPIKDGAAPSVLPHISLPFTPALALQAAVEPSVETYNCTTLAAQDVFELGDRVCVRATGVPAAAFPEFSWRVSWVDPAGLIDESDLGQVDTATEYDYTLPSDEASTRFDSSPGANDGILVNNRGTWRVNLTRASGAIRATAYFTVRSAANPVADIYVQKFAAKADSAVGSGSPIKFIVVVANNGPDAAANVVLADSLPAGSSLASFSQVSGPECLPVDSQNCTIASLGGSDRAEFEAIYIASGPAGTVQTSATVSTGTSELDTDNNTATAQFELTAAGGSDSTCALECPNDIITVANTFQGTTHGANVNFGSAEVFGSCGAVSASPASGTFFPVGTTTVSVSSSTGGGSCSFSVTVVEDPPPSVSCPAPVTATAEGCSAEVSAEDLGTPTTTGGTGTVTVVASRSDSQPLNAPFSVGTTTITYTATDSAGRIGSCTQTVTVTAGNDTAPPTITAPPNLTLSTGASGGACGLVVSEATLGTAEAADDGCSVNISRTGVPLGNFFPVGTTTVTWKATDGAGNMATATQTVTVQEDTPPSIEAPPNASYTCESEVPPAAPSQANGGDPNLPGGGPPSDNCGVPVVTVTESRAGAGNASSPLVITRTFTATDASGNSANSVQTITVIDSTPPTIALVGASSVTHECHAPFNDPGVTTGDNCNAQVNVATSGGFNPDAPGTYVITYTATDGVGNTATVQRTVTVVDTIAPVIALNGANPLTWECHTPFVDPGATASDSCDTSVPVNASGSVNVNVPGTYTLTYNASDDSGNAATPVTRTVNVVDTIAPVITLSGANPLIWECHTPFTDPGASASDSCDTTVPVNASGTVNTNVPGTYSITYTASDDSGNAAVPVTRTVNVVDTTAPLISCPANIVVTLPLNSTATSMPVNFSVSASDSCDSTVAVATSAASGSNFPVGTTVVTATATDDANNSASCSFSVTVLYNFTGFFSPVSNLPTINKANAGQNIPLKFSLSGNKGLAIFAPGYPASQQINCSDNAPVNNLEEAVMPGSNTLTYSPDQYHYNWKTVNSWAGTCRALVVVLNDGSTHTALFKFK